MSLTAGQLAVLRDDHPHVIKTYLTIIKPATVYIGTITGSPARGARSFTVVDVSGDIADAVAGNTIIVRDTIENIIICKRRYRSRVGNVITIDENYVAWENDWQIEILENWELWSVYPWVDSATHIFYKDRDIAYTDENLYTKPVAIAGYPKVGFLDGSSVTFDLDASASYATADSATITTYAWSCTGGSILDSADPTTTITFTSAGLYWLKLTVTDSNSKSQVTYRPIRVHDRSGVEAPYTDFEITGPPSGSWDDGGWIMGVTIHGDADQEDIPDGAMLILWTEEWYNGVSLSYNSTGNIRFCGYVLSEHVTKSNGVSQIDMQLGTINKLMELKSMYSVNLDLVTDAPTTWHQCVNLTIPRAIHYYFRWHSTLLEVVDVFLPISNDIRIPSSDDLEAGNLYNVANQFAHEFGIFAKLVCNKAGQLYMEQDLLMQTDVERLAADVVMTITTQDRIIDQDIEFTYNKDSALSYVLLSGIARISDVWTLIMAKSPGDVPESSGEQNITIERQALTDQASANYLAGRVYYRANNPITEMRMKLAGNYPVDVVPQKFFHIHVPASYTKKGVAIDEDIVVRNIDSGIDQLAGSIMPYITAELDFESDDGQTIVPPEDPGEDTYDPPTPWNPEPWNPPIFPPTLPPSPPDPPILRPCATDDDAPENGPYIQLPTTLPHTLYSNSLYGDTSLQWVYPSSIRTSTADHLTKMLIHGWWQTYDGANWITKNNNDWWKLEALDVNGSVTATATPVEVPGGHTTKTCEFLSGPYAVDKYKISLNEDYEAGKALIQQHAINSGNSFLTSIYEWSVVGAYTTPEWVIWKIDVPIDFDGISTCNWRATVTHLTGGNQECWLGGAEDIDPPNHLPDLTPNGYYSSTGTGGIGSPVQAICQSTGGCTAGHVLAQGTYYFALQTYTPWHLTDHTAHPGTWRLDKIEYYVYGVGWFELPLSAVTLNRLIIEGLSLYNICSR